MVWGCVAYDVKSELCICERSVDAEYYTEMLSNYLLPCMPNSNEYTFMQDNARPHIAKLTRNWLDENDVTVLEAWPSNSPDINPIEYVWSWMIKYVNNQAPVDRASFERAILSAWENLPQDIIRSYIEHLRKACQKIIQTHGQRASL